MRYPPAHEEDDAHLTLQPWPSHRKNGSLKHRSRSRPKRRRRMLTAGAAIVAAAAIESGMARAWRTVYDQGA